MMTAYVIRAVHCTAKALPIILLSLFLDEADVCQCQCTKLYRRLFSHSSFETAFVADLLRISYAANRAS